MFIIYEEKFRYITQDTTSMELGFVDTEEKAIEHCTKLNKSVEGKNKINTMANWRYYYKKINRLS